jgi:hypothetical protein
VLGRHAEDRVLILDVRLPRQDKAPQRLHVSMNGADAGVYQVEAGEDSVLKVPVPAVVSEGLVAVMLEVESTWSPRQYGMADDRQLGVAVVRAGWGAVTSSVARGAQA